MKAVVFSGTTEGRVFSRQLAALGAEVLVSVATSLGAEEQGKADGISVHCGRLTTEEMTALLQGAALCVDATHPYAVDATKNIRAACAMAGVEYHRLLRSKGQVHSILDDIPGIGPTRRKELMRHFQGIDDIKAATVEELSGLPGMNKKAAEQVYTFFHAPAQEENEDSSK